MHLWKAVKCLLLLLCNFFLFFLSFSFSSIFMDADSGDVNFLERFNGASLIHPTPRHAGPERRR